VDVLVSGGAVQRFEGERIAVPRTHGTGCTLSAAIAAGLALGLDLASAVARARRFVHAALAAAPTFGGGARPLDHRVPTG
jgi:hydroxymethylpyrimidine/phosphomethylpyrimidine kinase